MTEPPTAQRPDRGPPALHRAFRPWHLLVAGVAIYLLIVASQALEPTERIDEITVENPTRYDISIQVTDADRDGRITLGTARRQTTSTFEEVIDQGEVWIFRFAAQGEEGGELRRTRAQLERDNWHIEVPTSVSDELQSQGAPYSP